jgi:glycosyltransferase involved in cell wall biosynthesis
VTADVLVLSSSFPFGTGESFLAADLEGLHRQGLRVVVAPMLPRGRRNGWVPPDGCEVVLPAKWRANPLTGVRWAAGRDARTGGYDPERNPGMSRFHPVRREFAAAALSRPVAHIARMYRVRHIHAYWATGPATAAMLAAQSLDLTWSFTGHAGDIYGNRSLRHKGASASCVRVISGFGKEAVLSLGVCEHKVHLIHIGVAIPPPGMVHPTAPDRFHGVCAASLEPRKGQRVLLQALAQLRERGHDLRVALAGDGPDRHELEQLAQTLGVGESVEFLGFVPHERLIDQYAEGRYDFMVLPSTGTGRAAEGIPVSLMEAMSFGVPSIATDSGGVAELIPHGSALLVPPGDARALARAIEELQSSVALRQAAAKEARQRIEADFNVDRTGAELAALIRSSVAGSAAGQRP